MTDVINDVIAELRTEQSRVYRGRVFYFFQRERDSRFSFSRFLAKAKN